MAAAVTEPVDAESRGCSRTNSLVVGDLEQHLRYTTPRANLHVLDRGFNPLEYDETVKQLDIYYGIGTSWSFYPTISKIHKDSFLLQWSVSCCDIRAQPLVFSQCYLQTRKSEVYGTAFIVQQQYGVFTKHTGEWRSTIPQKALQSTRGYQRGVSLT